MRFKKERENIVKVQVQTLRRICGIRKQVSEDILLRELDMQPIEIGWWKRTINLYNSVRALPADNIYHKIACDDYHLNMGGNRKTLLQSLISGPNAKGYAIIVQGDRLPPIDLETAQDLLSSDANRVWQGLSENPRTCPSQGAQLCTYKRWMAIPIRLLVAGRSCMSTWTQVKYGSSFDLEHCVTISQSTEGGSRGLESHVLTGFVNIVHRVKSEMRYT